MSRAQNRIRGTADITSAADAGSIGRPQNAAWKLFKLEMSRLRHEREQKLAEQQLRMAERRIAQAEARMRAVLSSERLGPLVNPSPESRQESTDGPMSHRYGVRRV